MKRTNDLIAELAARPWPATRPAFRLAVAMIAGWTVVLAGFVLVLGPPLGAVLETGATPFALKLGYTLALTIIAAVLTQASGRPGQELKLRSLLLALPVMTVAAVATIELAAMPPAHWTDLLFGSTSLICVVTISIASLPVFAVVMWALRTFAPTKLPLAGFLSGLSAGAASSLAYALYCRETAASFLLASYTPGILLPAIIGVLLGPRLLRW